MTIADASTRTTLAEHLRGGPLSPELAAQLLWAICGRLEAEHGQAAVGDVDPSRVVLEDGLRTMAPHVSPSAVATGAFSAPERARSGPTPQSDVYSLGALLYAALTGHPPDGRPLPDEASSLLPVVEKCLAKDPAQRFANIGELKRALARLDRTHVSGNHPAVAAPIPLQQAKTLGPWQLEKLLGEGSMGQVFKGRHAMLGRVAAIKVLRPEQYKNRELIQRFFQEARTVNQINHEHIVEISDFVEEPGPDGPSIVYCVMELLDGRSVDEELRAGPLSLARTVSIVEQLADALAAAHRVGVVHRDVKPENVMLIHRAGSHDYVKVLDFGVAKLTAPDGKSMVATMDGAIIGTPICMSPEQAQGDAVDARTDIWAVGVILYRLLAGVLPFDAPNFTSIAVKIITAPMPPLPDKTPTGEPIPPELARLVSRCLEKDREKRPQKMEEVREALHALRAGPTTMELEAHRPPRRGAGLFIAAAVVLLLAGAGGAWFATRPPTEVPPPVEPVVAVQPPPVEPPPAQPPPVEPPPVEPPPTQPPPVEPPPVKPVEPPPVKPVKPVALTAAMVQQGVGRVRSRVMQCLLRNAAALTEKEGVVQVAFTIEPSGEVSGAKVVTAGLAGTPLEGCVVKEVSKARFPRHVGPARAVKVPFNYKLTE
ncbi:MAG: protein kinase [Myxococcota bacterium]